MRKRRSIVWFRLDLRLHDNEALTDAILASDQVLPVYVFDSRLFSGKTKYGFPRIGHHRLRFLIESVTNLRHRLRDLGSDLIIRVGRTEEEIFRLARTYKTTWVFCNRERTRDEVLVQDRLEKSLWTVGQEMRYSRGKMLYYTQDLPFPVTATPDTFAAFKKEVEHYLPVRFPLETPAQIPPMGVDVDPGRIPSLTMLINFTPPFDDGRANMDFHGGEEAGLQRLETFFWKLHAIEHYDRTKNELVDSDDSSRFSPWISHGCLSPKKIYQQLMDLKSHVENREALEHFFQQLICRDYHRLIGKKYENRIFLKGGTRGVSRQDLEEDFEKLNMWILGKTGEPLVDACMNELSATGYLSRRGRELVASYLINQLKVHWQMGAEYFEYILIDYDPCSNYGNWNLMAGVSCDTRKEPSFNIKSQTKTLDPSREYIRKWVGDYAER